MPPQKLASQHFINRQAEPLTAREEENLRRLGDNVVVRDDKGKKISEGPRLTGGVETRNMPKSAVVATALHHVPQETLDSLRGITRDIRPTPRSSDPES